MKEIDVIGLIKLLVGALAPAAVFYGIGYMITRAYVISTGLQASFWFTEAFYREAGGRLLLDIVIAVALLPHVFIPLSALFLVLFPGEIQPLGRYRHSRLYKRLSTERGIVVRDTAFAIVVLLAVSALVFMLKDCGDHRCASALEAPGWLFTSSWLFAEAQDKWLLQQPLLYPMALFLALAIPTAVTLGLWASRSVLASPDTAQERPMSSTAHTDPPGHATSHPLTTFLIASAFVVLTVYIPIAYGAYFYDFVVVSLVDTDKCAVESVSEPTTAAATAQGAGPARPRLLQCYLLGRFETRYILVGRESRTSPPAEASGEQTDHRIYIKQVDRLEPFAIESWKSTPLRSLTPVESRAP